MTRKRGRRRSVALVGASLTLLAALGVSACGSLPKDELEERLLALGKNAPARDHGLERRTFTARLEGEDVEVEATYLHVPARRTEEAGGRPVVLVHGTPSSLFTWTEVIFGGDGYAGLAEDHDVYALDVIGHGVTRTETPPYTFQRCADYVAAWIDELGLGPVHLVGNSYGGEFCLRVALDRPDLVESLVLVDSAGLTRADDEWLPEEVAMREMWLAPVGHVLNSRERIETALRPHFRALDPERVEEIFLVCENADNWGAMVDLARDENGDREPDLPDVAARTLLLWGADDVAYTVDRFARRFEEAIPGARLHLVPECGHYPQEERPAEFVRVLRAFLNE